MHSTSLDPIIRRTLKCYPLTYQEDALYYFERLRHLEGSILLDSGKPLSEGGRFDIMSAEPLAVIETDRYGIARCPQRRHISIDPIEAQRELLKDLRVELDGVPEHIPFKGGLLGFWSYEFSKLLERIPSRPHSELAHALDDVPLARLGLYDWAIVQDHQRKEAWLIATNRRRRQILPLLTARRVTHPAAPFALLERFQPTWSAAEYQAAFDQVIAFIRSGDCYQINLTQRFSAACEGDAWMAYRQLRKATPSPFSAFMCWGTGEKQQAILSVSPERFIQAQGRRITTQPIKGTRPRGTTPDEDAKNALELQQSEKDRAENVMIVDLLRNDIGQVCSPGSVRVPYLTQCIAYENVHHLVSTITGILDDRYDAFDLFRACFPGGSITGAPKIRAMEIIEQLEPCQRSVYCGAIGYIDIQGHMDTSIAIRTALIHQQTVHLWGGGGIVDDSRVSAEYAESLTKIRHLMQALEQSGPTDEGGDHTTE
ncbi:aminodeoxychorismate synthase component I [Zymobacter palmae]|uniref:aminodeoxychorismate synthase n=1 Tax=Zymobacter palmae TaxID=33074 RepID=A0A348HGQ8_9GAMM|nr:aminodeoxychorismate synthase component I [Zymobacter palmae]BBG30810.1 anthranilate/para-aminobenzoate synthases [Zymobacter palmae]